MSVHYHITAQERTHSGAHAQQHTHTVQTHALLIRAEPSEVWPHVQIHLGKRSGTDRDEFGDLRLTQHFLATANVSV